MKKKKSVKNNDREEKLREIALKRTVQEIEPKKFNIVMVFSNYLTLIDFLPII